MTDIDASMHGIHIWLSEIEQHYGKLNNLFKQVESPSKTRNFVYEKPLKTQKLQAKTKQHIYSCRNKGYPPSFKTYLAKVSLIYQIETTIADSNGKRTFHDVKWKKFLLNYYSSSGSV